MSEPRREAVGIEGTVFFAYNGYLYSDASALPPIGPWSSPVLRHPTTSHVLLRLLSPFISLSFTNH